MLLRCALCSGLRRHVARTLRPTARRLSSLSSQFDVIVVGGGHAGTEAACAAARMGSRTLLVTHKIETIGEMSCNPSFGGIGKGHLLKEVDALDGVCARICDQTGIHYKMLNKRKGPAVWGPRAQIDRAMYKRAIQEEVLNTHNLTVTAASVEDLILLSGREGNTEKQHCTGVILDGGRRVRAAAVVLTTGTFLQARIHLGLDVTAAGRMGDTSSVGLARTLQHAGFKTGRMKTGTPPRLDGDSIDFTMLPSLAPDDPPVPFSFLNDRVWIKPEDQLLCHHVYTNADVKAIILDNAHLNRHVQEESAGPRYCPSIESKVMRFGATSHRIWLEPEDLQRRVIYPQGLSCTLPPDLQQKVVNAIPGLQSAIMTKPGYGVEYDYVDPRQLRSSLETRLVHDLFFAGQINGTTGYEEAAAQGLVAGVNAVLKARREPPLLLSRTEAYIGVLIDDLTTLGTTEPYRMFTSRAEFRLTLRPDNADMRLTERGFHAGCVGRHRYEEARRVRTALDAARRHLEDNVKTVMQWRADLKLGHNANTSRRSAFDMLATPQVTTQMLADTYPDTFSYLIDDPNLANRLNIEASYKAALSEELEEIKEIRRDEQLVLPEDIDYESLNFSTESKLKLSLCRPRTIAAASRIPGLTPAAILILLRYVKKNWKQTAELNYQR